MSRRTPLNIAFARPWPGTLRGLVLWLFSLAFVALGGINYILTPLPARTEKALSFALSIAPSPAWGALMVTAGLLSALSAYCHFGRDRYGYLILSTFCGAWGAGYIAGFVLFGADLRSLSGSVIWLLFAGVLTAVAGFPNVPLAHAARPGWDRE